MFRWRQKKIITVGLLYNERKELERDDDDPIISYDLRIKQIKFAIRLSRSPLNKSATADCVMCLYCK